MPVLLHRVPCQDRVAESRGKAFNLRDDARLHVHSGMTGDVAVGPQGVLARRRPGRIGHRLLAHEDEGALAVPSREGVALGRRDFGERPADVHGASFAAGFVRPRHRAAEGVVDLEDARTVPEGVEPSAKSGGQLVARDASHDTGRSVEQVSASGR